MVQFWPSKKGLGTKLSYGNYGNGIISINQLDCKDNIHNCNNENITITSSVEFPRKKCSFNNLYLIDKSKVILNFKKQSNNEKNNHNHINESHNLKNNIYIPKKIITSNIIESNILSSEFAYDPTDGRLISIFDIKFKKSKKYHKIILYSTGNLGNILSISLISNYFSKVCEKDNIKDFQIVNTPKLLNQINIIFNQKIKQIEVNNFFFDKGSFFIIVRTNNIIYILLCFKSLKKKKLKSEYEIISELNSKDFYDHEFSDLTFNPWNTNQFSVVDIKGNFGVWTIKNINNKYKILRNEFNSENFEYEPTIFDPCELSNWKRISWAYDSNHLILVSRSSLVLFKLEPCLISKQIITSKVWSRIQDIYKIDDYFITLTSKEIIIFHLNQSLEKVISWKHYLKEDDMSLKLFVLKTKDDLNLKCLIYSQLHSLIFIYDFGKRNGRLCFLKNPYFIKKTSDISSLQDLNFFSLNEDFYLNYNEKNNKLAFEMFVLLELSIENEFCYSIYSTRNSLILTNLSEINFSNEKNENQLKSQLFLFNKITLNDLLTLKNYKLIANKNHLKKNLKENLDNSESLFEIIKKKNININSIDETFYIYDQINKSINLNQSQIINLVPSFFFKKKNHELEIHDFLNQIEIQKIILRIKEDLNLNKFTKNNSFDSIMLTILTLIKIKKIITSDISNLKIEFLNLIFPKVNFLLKFWDDKGDKKTISTLEKHNIDQIKNQENFNVIKSNDEFEYLENDYSRQCSSQPINHDKNNFLNSNDYEKNISESQSLTSNSKVFSRISKLSEKMFLKSLNKKNASSSYLSQKKIKKKKLLSFV